MENAQRDLNQNKPSVIVARIIPELLERSIHFLAAKKKDLKLLLDLNAEKKFTEMSFIDYQMKNTAGNYGMQPLADLTEKLCIHLEKKESEIVDQLLLQIKDYLSKVVVVQSPETKPSERS